MSADPWPIERMKELYGPRVEPPGPLSISARERREPKPMRRTKAVKKRNPERLARRREAQFSDCARMARLQPCCICGRLGPSDASHVVSRGAGGKDTGNVVPMCRKHHGLMSAPGWGAKRVEEHYGVSLEVIASYVLDSVRAHCCTEWPMCDSKTGATVCRVCHRVRRLLKGALPRVGYREVLPHRQADDGRGGVVRKRSAGWFRKRVALERGESITAGQPEGRRPRDELRWCLMEWIRDPLTDAKDAYEINCGECEDFALYVVEHLVDEGYTRAFVCDSNDHVERQGEGDPGYWHCWVHLDGLHYDSEATDGVTDWQDLPFFKRWAPQRAHPPDIEATRFVQAGLAWERLRRNPEFLA